MNRWSGATGPFAQQPQAQPANPFGVPAQAQQAQQQAPAPTQGGYWNPTAEQPKGSPVGEDYAREPAYPPMLLWQRGYYYVPKNLTVRFGGAAIAAGAQTQQLYQFTKDATIMARTVSVFKADNADLPVGRSEATCAQLRLSRSYTAGSDSIDIGPGQQGLPSAQNLWGTGGLPGFFMLNGLQMKMGSTMAIDCTTLLANIQVDATLMLLEKWPLGQIDF